MIGIVVSRADRASTHVGERLREVTDWTTAVDDSLPADDGGGTVYRTAGFELRTFADLHLELTGVASAFDDPELVVFASRHSGETGPLLTAHHTGNVGPAEFGGRANTLATAAPNALARLYHAMAESAPAGYDVGIECTHHGPSTVGAPSLFAELGSGPDEWDDTAGATALARAILALRGVSPTRERQLVGFGGGHYAPRFERIIRETDWAVGHVAADWALAAVTDRTERRAVVDQSVARSGAAVVVIDGDRPALGELVEDLGHRVVSETWVRETNGVELAVVDVVEDRLGAVDDGVRFGTAATDASPADLVVETLPGDLLEAANGADGERVRTAVAERSVAFATTEGGTRVAGPVVRERSTDRRALVDALADVLATAWDDVEREPDAIVATRTVFAPDRARELGVPEGPAFGRLADGESVTVDGATVTPEMVVRTETCRFEIP